ncbi:superoxide dismutase family protein [Tomitella fengzijianii]|uniref:superoxide dismutase family protein n=1 Tax=Tomitella fengzijianii TaxID=2597660 RepID=UPI00131D4457|nr:superoxide dismutase family protein [Tomitella fengzijianii]
MDARRATSAKCAAAAVALAAAATTAACGSDAAAPPPADAAPPTSHVTAGAFLTPEIASNAVTYDPAKVPLNSTATVTESVHGSQTVVTLNVSGLQPSTEYGVHATTQPCGKEPGSAGARYQNRPDPASSTGQPSTDPEYANPSNELWLDFTTTAAGTAYGTRTLGWTFRPGEARSLVFLDHLTSTGSQDAGDAGARLACLDVDF